MWEGIHPLERYLASAGGLEDTDLDSRSLHADENDVGRRRTITKQEGRHHRGKLVMVLAEVLLLDLSSKEFERVIDLLRGYGLDMLLQGRFKAYTRLLSRLNQRVAQLGGEHKPAAKQLTDELMGAEAARRALASLEAERCDDPPAAVTLLSELTPKGMALLWETAAEKIAKEPEQLSDGVLAKALERAAAERPEVLLGDPAKLEERHLRLMAKILPQPVPPEVAEKWSEQLGSLSTSTDPGIRLGLLHLLASVQPPDLERILIYALEDEDGKVRTTAATLISNHLGARALQPLLQVLLSPDFEAREYSEQAEFYMALAKASPQEVYPLLEKTISRRSWLAPRRWRMQKACALRALGAIPIEKAGPILIKFRDSRDLLLAEASREALESHRRNLQGDGEGSRRAA
jgi:HEAT repeat protein